jgi:hypothetical protein
MSQDNLKMLYNKMFVQPVQEDAEIINDVLPDAVIENIIVQPKAMIKGTVHTTYRPSMEEFERLFGDFYEK